MARASLKLPPSVPRSIAVTAGPAARASPVEAPPAPARRAATARTPKIRSEVNSLPLLLGVPEGRVNVTGGRIARADRVAASVDGEGLALSAAEGAEVDHPACVRPGEGMGRDIPRDAGGAHHLATCVHVPGGAVAATDGAEVDHPARLRPGEGGGGAVGGGGGGGDHTAAAGGAV